eukprot:CAMPEP_0185847932 /NCGR_PEP_ID=MMETSP1354-20130828/2998_1 /TAXON_ID=708628 /ORGANISM="Erythrolobus madagascarensis, Strain CCMP3276" /LENGTH=134 /DNA_ID=CAMNT_0028548267 /DNA_START=81 /DNA_END=485 /DNA_ORIENTATION=-
MAGNMQWKTMMCAVALLVMGTASESVGEQMKSASACSEMIKYLLVAASEDVGAGAIDNKKHQMWMCALRDDVLLTNVENRGEDNGECAELAQIDEKFASVDDVHAAMDAARNKHFIHAQNAVDHALAALPTIAV